MREEESSAAAEFTAKEMSENECREREKQGLKAKDKTVISVDGNLKTLIRNRQPG